MTNAEKLAKNKKFMRNACVHYDCSNHYCGDCPLYSLHESGNYHECKRDDTLIDKWLESEAKDDGEIY